MGILAFDTHKAVKVLRDAGADEHLAEAVVDTIGSAMGENVATKTDITELKISTKADIDALKVSTKADIAELKVWLLGHLWVAVGVIIGALSLLAYLFLPNRPG